MKKLLNPQNKTITKPWSAPANQGLLQQIRCAPSISFLHNLVNKSETYHSASDKTRRRWVKAAAQREQELLQAYELLPQDTDSLQKKLLSTTHYY